MKFKKIKSKKKKPWVDMEVRDLKRIVTNLGKFLRHQPFNLQIRHTFFNTVKTSKESSKGNIAL